MKNDKRIGIIGYGGMGEWHAESIKNRIKGGTVTGVFDINEVRLNKAAASGLSVFRSAEELLKSGIDIVVIAVPNDFHKQYSLEAMRAGVAVVCEKPACLNSAELEEVLDCSVKAGVFFTVHHNRRWDIDYEIVKQSINSGLIGKPYFINSRLFGCKGLPGDWRNSKSSGGGMLYDWSIHLIDQILCLIDSEIKSVYCEAASITSKEVDDCNRILITFENGVRAQIVVDTWCYINENRWHISASDGTLMMSEWLEPKGKIIKANREIDWNEGVVVTSTGRSRTIAPIAKEKLQELPLPDAVEPRWEEFYENIFMCLDNNTAPLITHSQLRKSMKVLDACFLSVQSGETIKFPEMKYV